MRPMGALSRTLVTLCVLLVACSDPESPQAPRQQPADETAVSGPPPEILRLNNRGVGEMGHFDYAAAVETFEQVTTRAPEWVTGRVNHAIAVLNRQQSGDESRALEMLDAIVAEHPAELAARYMRGILRFNAGRTEEALADFNAVAAEDPRDAYAAYFAGQCLLQLGQADAALERFQAAMEADPYLRSAYYGAFMVRQRSGETERAQELLADYQRLDDNPRSRLAEIKYTRMGPKSLAQAVQPAAADIDEPPVEGRLFGERVTLAEYPQVLGPVVSASLLQEPASHALLLVHGRDGNLALDLETGERLETESHPFLASGDILASAWGDFDNDGRTDLFLARDGANQLWRRDAKGWLQHPLDPDDPGLRTVDAIMLDADHDGDLDLFVVNENGADELYNNNGDGSFRRLAVDRSLTGPKGSKGVLARDLDRDRDVDLVVLGADETRLYRNDRLWRYDIGPLTVPEGFVPTVLTSTDRDVDGRLELTALARDGRVLRWPWDQPEQAETLLASGSGVQGLSPVDFDGDGMPGLLLVGQERWRVEGEGGAATSPWQPGRFLALWTATSDQGPGVVDLRDGRIGLHPPGPGRRRFLAVSFSGAEDPGQSMRSNFSGIGVEFVLRAGPIWSAGTTHRASSGPGQSLQPQVLGMGSQDRADYLEIDWPDGVFQTELGLEQGQLRRITETQRQLASCPVLFAWDGERYRFLSDVLGVGGIGFAVGPGEYAQPRPRERFRIPSSMLAAREGALELLLTEPMEEIAYLDSVSLEVVDYPAGLGMALDERMDTGEPRATGEALFFSERYPPREARDGTGHNWLQRVAARDLEAPDPGPRDRRFPGFLEQAASLELRWDFDLSVLEQPALLIDGWVEYGYSQTGFAAWQAGKSYQPPSLDVLVDGVWEELLPHFGYPAGMPREAALRLPRLPSGSTGLRLRSNQEIYWDRLLLVDLVAETPAITRPLALTNAVMEFVGFPERSDGPQRQPSYDFARRAAFWDTKYPSGAYTRYGPAGPLVAERDGALAIIGPGDGLRLRFNAQLPPLESGWNRDFVVTFHGWAKDMDLYTRDGETVGPLPGRDRLTPQARDLEARYNTRYRSGR